MIEKLCILTINFSFDRQVIMNQLEKIIPQEVELFLFVPKECKGKYNSTRIKIIESEKSKYACFFEFRKFCRKNKIDRTINLGQLPQEGLIMLFASAFSKTDFICYLLTDPLGSLKIGFNKWVVKFFIEDLLDCPLALFPKKIFVCSKDITDYCKKYIFLRRNQIHRIPVPLDTAEFSPKDKALARKKIKLNKTDKVVIYVGRIETAKGSDLILNVAKKNKDITFILVGKVNDKRIKIPTVKNIRLTSSLTNHELIEYYNASDLCLFPSRAESFGIVPREAMACGIPTIVSDITALRQIEPAIKVPLNSEEISKAINSFFSLSKKEKELLSEKSRKFVVEECSLEVCKDLYLNFLLN
jgi:glycosyltransferase involved in cell wall biosynthesis